MRPHPSPGGSAGRVDAGGGGGGGGGGPAAAAAAAAPMDRREESWCRLREQQRAARAAAAQQQQRTSSDQENQQANMHGLNYLESWIVNLLLEYTTAETRADDQLGHILKVLDETRTLQNNEESPAATLRIADGCHYIRAVVTGKAVQQAKCSLLQSGFSNIAGQFIVLRNYRVCFKEASTVEDCEFYLLLDHFRIMPMKRQEMKQVDCNREPSVLQKIKEIWMRSLALQPWSSTEPSSVSDVLREIKQEQLGTLKQNVEDCLNLLDSGQMLDSEQLAIYPDTKWQMERRKDKMHQDTFTVPSELLAINAENQAALCKACSATDSENLDGSLENPWDIFPGMTLLSSTDVSGTAPSLPNTQQVLLASTAEEEETPCGNSCSPDLEAHAHIPCCSYGQDPSGSTTFPTCKESANQETSALNTTGEAGRISDIDDSVPCGEPLNNPHLNTMCLLSSADPPARKDLSLGVLSDSIEGDHLAHLQKNTVVVREAGEKSLHANRKSVLAKRKKIPSEEECMEISSSPDCMNHTTQEQAFPVAFPKSTNPVFQKSPLRFMSVPKRSRTEEVQVVQQQVPAQFKCTNGLQEKRRDEEEVTTRRLEKYPGVKQLDCRRRAPIHVSYNSVTPELCSKVASTRISRALLGWAQWIFSSVQKQ